MFSLVCPRSSFPCCFVCLSLCLSSASVFVFTCMSHTHTRTLTQTHTHTYTHSQTHSHAQNHLKLAHIIISTTLHAYFSGLACVCVCVCVYAACPVRHSLKYPPSSSFPYCFSCLSLCIWSGFVGVWMSICIYVCMYACMNVSMTVPYYRSKFSLRTSFSGSVLQTWKHNTLTPHLNPLHSKPSCGTLNPKP